MIDFMLAGIIGGAAFRGFSSGFVRRLFSLAFIALAFVAAAYLREIVAGLIKAFAPTMHPDYPGLIGFGGTFVAVLIGLHLLSRPFLKRVAVSGMSMAADRALGIGLGLLEGTLLASVAIMIIVTYASDDFIAGFTAIGVLPDIAEALDKSVIASFLMTTTVPLVTAVLGPLLPKDIVSAIELLPIK